MLFGFLTGLDSVFTRVSLRFYSGYIRVSFGFYSVFVRVEFGLNLG